MCEFLNMQRAVKCENVRAIHISASSGVAIAQPHMALGFNAKKMRVLSFTQITGNDTSACIQLDICKYAPIIISSPLNISLIPQILYLR